ncbi:D-alanyl-D-alanine carboxypeptidase family protein [Ferviditalea candida]|uniref:D-alanyl-D-alanine carboxypeptidase family protein n=1 Tax=Ferviditalea candida TaxID=3108399 RepID=A0ABU5ZJX7_9BACL|nr:D-alanyl-D-alanine carboxypeptidase family protein [Paenibacillaceae bacterium T2]
MRNRLLSLCLALLVYFAAAPLTFAGAPNPPSIHAEAAALIDVQSGKMLMSLNGNKRMRIASLTKIMTAIVAIEKGNLSDKVKVGPRAFGVEGSSIYLKKGEEMSLQNLLYGLMLRSGNDAAVAIAEHVGGSVDGFVYLMNEEAKLIGMTNSHFVNPHGLDAQDHYSTADDMAKLTAYALRNPVFREIVKTKVKTAPNPNEPWDYKWRNKNKMLTLYDGADGVKTGYTKLARRCLSSSATRNGQQLAVVTLDDSNDWADHQLLLDYGFKNFPEREIIRKGQLVENTNAVAAQSFVYPLADSEISGLSQKTELYEKQSTAYRLGEKGRVVFYLEGRQIGAVPLVDQYSTRLNLTDRSALNKEAASAPWSGFAQVWAQLLKALFTLNRESG